MKGKNIVQNLAKERTSGWNSNIKIAAIIVAIIIVALVAFCEYRFKTASVFANGSKLDGIDVSGLKLAPAIEKITESNNKITIKEEGSEPIELVTKYTYDIKSQTKKALALSNIDPRAYFFGGASYKVALKNKGGIKETAAILSENIGNGDNVKLTTDAYIDYTKMEIVPEVQGDSIDFEKLSKEIAAKKESDFNFNTYNLDRAKLISVPKVKAASLADELEFAKKYIASGLTMNSPAGIKYNIEPSELAKVILYSKSGPKYSESGAKEIATLISKKLADNYLEVNTLAGVRKIPNYELRQDIDIDKTAAAILKAAKSGKEGEAVANEAAKKTVANASSHVEVNLSAQTVSFVIDGRSTFSTPIVSGGPGHRTPTGIFTVKYKTRNTTLKGNNDDGSKYESPVSYWMPFNGGIGFHDATWRGAFGGGIYLGDGSHGCINMPPASAARLFNLVGAGTVVYVYR